MSVSASIPVGDGSLAVNGVLADGNAQANVVQLTGTLANILSTLATLTYTVPDAEFNSINNGGDVVVSVTANDLGNSGIGGPGNTVRSFNIVVNPSNDSPIVTVGPSPASINEGAGASTAITGVSVFDQETGSVSEAGTGQMTVTLSIPAGQGSVFVNPGLAGGAPVISGNNSNVVTLQGSPSQLNVTLSSIQYTVPDADFNSSRNGGDVLLTVTANDQGNSGNGGPRSHARSIPISVVPINDAPQFTIGPNVLRIEDSGAVVIPNWATGILPGSNLATDENSQTLTFGFNTTLLSGDVAFANGPSIDPSTGALSFETAADSFGVIRVVVFLTDDGLSVAPNANRSANQTFTLTVTEVNDVPVPTNDGLPNPLLTVLEDNTLTITSAALLGNDTTGPSNESNQSLSIIAVSTTSDQGGTVSVSAGVVSYRPAQDYFGIDSFTYTIRDNGTDAGVLTPRSAVGTVTVSVTALNDAPVAVPDAYEVDEDSELVVAGLGVLLNDIDVDSLSVTVNLADANSALGVPVTVNSDGTFLYDPRNTIAAQQLALGQTVTDTFTYRISDGFLTSNTTTVSITLSGRNDAPTSSAQGFAIGEDGPAASANFAGDDIDVDDSQGSLSYSIFADIPAGQGTLTNNGNGTFSFAPGSDFQTLNAGEQRLLNFTYRATDSHGVDSSPLGTATITVNGINDIPTASSFSVSTTEDGPNVTDLFRGEDADADNNSSDLTYTILGNLGAGQGTVTNQGNGTFIFNPGNDFQDLPAGQSRVVSFTYIATDRHSGTSNAATVTLTVSGANDAPSVGSVTVNAVENGPSVTSNFAGDDVDSDDDASTIVYTVVTPPAAGQGTVTNHNNGTFSYNPGLGFQDLALGETRSIEFTYRARDSHATNSLLATVTVTITGTNDAPTVSVVGISAAENGSQSIHSFIGDDIDSDDTSTSLVYSFGTPLGAGQGSLALAGGTSFSYSPGSDFQNLAEGQTQVVSATYVATDSHAAVSAPAAISITVSGTNDAPTASPVTISATENGANALGNFLGDDIDSDDDPDSLIYSIVQTLPASSGSVFKSGSRTFTFSPGSDFQNLAVGETQTVTFTYRATDRHGAESPIATVTVTVTGVNDVPSASNVSGIVAFEDGGPVNGAFVATDVDSDGSSAGFVFEVVALPTQGVVTLSGNPGDTNFAFNPGASFQNLSAGQVQPVTFTYLVRDSHGDASVPATVTVNVTGVNDTPVATNVSVAAVENGNIVVGNFSASDADSDEPGAGLVYSVVTPPSEGSVSVNGIAGSNSFSFNPAGAFNDLALGETRNVTFTYRVRDTHSGDSNVATATVVVTGVNDAPVSQNVSGIQAVENGAPVAGNFSTIDVDSDELGSGLRYELITQPAEGSVAIPERRVIVRSPSILDRRSKIWHSAKLESLLSHTALKIHITHLETRLRSR